MTEIVDQPTPTGSDRPHIEEWVARGWDPRNAPMTVRHGRRDAHR